MTIVDLQKRIKELQAAADKAAEANDEAGAREAAGRLAEAHDMLVKAANDAIEDRKAMLEEQKARAKADFKSVGARALGAPSDFAPLTPGFRSRVVLDEAKTYGPSTLPTPSQTDFNLPSPVAAPMGFLDTLPTAVVNGDEHYFKAPVLTNAAAAWTAGTSKPQSDLQWTEDVATLETIAHWMPISKPTASRYSNLESTISGALMLGLAMKKDEHAVSGSNQSGIVGIKNQTGILTYTKEDGQNVYDMAVTMASRVRIASGFAPNCVAMPTAVLTSLKTLKGSDGHYLYPEIVMNGTLDGMTIVEDNNLAVTTTSDSTPTTKNGMIVYFSAGAEWRTADADAVTVGLTNEQFIQNTYTLLAEGTYSLKVPFPAAFCYAAEV